ncbi:transducin/WD40 repeat-like superfamily protein [Striga asiatica]|uniref:Transducin/WD40 repeat-like superfamily protein n=1 Tax=Striga asiatica TaxID=4170 RepID=A0A5A7RCX1_STRAF|nr:transducin/WD40 repeat-like superfamily protein [Striga asiatica]
MHILGNENHFFSTKFIVPTIGESGIIGAEKEESPSITFESNNMSGYRPLLKKPKIEPEEEDPEKEEQEDDGFPEEESNEEKLGEQIRNEQEEALVALIEHRTKEVEHLRQRINYYKSQLDEAEKRLEDTQTKLVRLRGWSEEKSSKNPSNGRDEVKFERKSQSPSQKQSLPHLHDAMKKPSVDNPDHGNYSKKQIQPKPPLVIPTVKANEPGNKLCGLPSTSSALTTANSLTKLKGEKTRKTSPEQENVEIQPKGTKRKIDEKEHVDLIPLVAKKSSPVTIRCHGGPLLSSQHKRKLRSLALCPTNDQLFVTSALDGMVNLWQLQGRGTPQRQIRLFDLRLRQTEIHSFGFKQESSESQSALINQAWSPDGLYISSGSVDPVIHIFDIRYNAQVPSQSIKSHQKRVFKAAWHYALPLLISISSDLNIGLHKIN